MRKKPDNRFTILIPVSLPIVKIGDTLDEIVLRALKTHAVRLRRGDVVAVASKVVSTCEGRLRELNQVRVTELAKRFARKWSLEERLTTMVLEETDEILGGVRGFLLTIKNRLLTANAGIDLKNCPAGNAILWPENADASAARLRRSLEKRHGVRVGVIVVDSRVTPMRLGTVGLAIGVSGLVPVIDLRHTADIYGRKARVTQTNVADDLASSAHLLMGETNERIGVVVARGTPVVLRDTDGSRRACLNISRCLVASNIIGAQTPRLTYGFRHKSGISVPS